jgi:hypothetical protein
MTVFRRLAVPIALAALAILGGAGAASAAGAAPAMYCRPDTCIAF